jgi:hypothetical protein
MLARPLPTYGFFCVREILYISEKNSRRPYLFDIPSFRLERLSPVSSIAQNGGYRQDISVSRTDLAF